MNGEATRFKPHNKAAEHWTEQQAIEVFEAALLNADNPNILCTQAAYRQAGIRPSTFHYLLEKFPVLESYKKDIEARIIETVNEGAIKGSFSAAPAIWRMKQLGEKDTSSIDHTNAGGKFDPPKIMFNE